MHGGGKVGTMRRGRPMSQRKGGLPWERESKHRLASDSSLACMGMPAREGSRSSRMLNSCHSFIHCHPQPQWDSKGGYRNKRASEKAPNLNSMPVTIWI